jgi:hypothetical protein
MLENEKYWNIASIFEYNVKHHKLLNIRECGDRERVSNGGVNLIKAWCIQAWSTKANPPWTINIHFKNEGQEGKIVLFWGWYLREVTGYKERVNEDEYSGFISYSYMKIEEWNLPKLKEVKGMRENDGRGNSTVHSKHMQMSQSPCSQSPCSTIIC